MVISLADSDGERCLQFSENSRRIDGPQGEQPPLAFSRKVAIPLVMSGCHHQFCPESYELRNALRDSLHAAG